MMATTEPVSAKIDEIIVELRDQGLWKQQSPGWVKAFTEKQISNMDDFAEWLQFILLPNLQQRGTMAAETKVYVAPQAVRFFGEDVRKGRLLQLLVELDSLL